LGNISLPSKQSNGVWEFDIIFNANNTNIIFMSNNKGIGINDSQAKSIFMQQPTSSNKLSFGDNVFGSFIRGMTLADEANNNIKFSIRLLKENNNVEVLIKGGSFGEVFIKPNLSSGSNPFTVRDIEESNYMNFYNNGAGTKVSNIVLAKGVVQ
jgi:hypothetical protein